MRNSIDSKISRRSLLGSGAAAGAGALLSAQPADAKTRKHAVKHPRKPANPTHTADVCVVGGGFAGLSAARALTAAGKSVIVLEARERVGGRAWCVPVPGTSAVVHHGATFVGPTQHNMLDLMQELGIGHYPTYATGKLLWYENGKGTPYTGQVPPAANPLAVIELGEVLLPKLDKMAATVPVDAPWTAPDAATWDSMTVDTWVRQNATQKDSIALVNYVVEAVLSVEGRDVSLLYVLWYAATAGSFEALVGNAGTGAAQDYMVQGGTQGVAIKVAQALGKRVLLGEPVSKITQLANGAVVHAASATVQCQQVIVAMPPHLAGRLDYDPILPGTRDQLTQRMPIGSLIKTNAVYDTPFWRGQGLNGQLTSDIGPVGAMFDASPADGSIGILLGFIDGDYARQLSDQDPATRQAAALASYVTYFGQQAANPKFYFDMPWERQEYTRGCPVGVAPPGVITEYWQALRAPVGRIHWAGTETSTVWAGYMDGAISSGKRAAAEVLAEL